MKKKILAGILLLGVLLISGCSEQDEVVDTLAGNSVSGGGSVQNSANQGSALAVGTLSTKEMFTDRDMEVGFDEGSDIMIALEGNSATSGSNAVQVKGSTVTITDEGTYIFSGSLDNGSIVVDAENTDKLQLVLNGVDITNESSAAIYIKQADKVFLTLAPESENTLRTVGEFVAIDENNIDAVIFSKDDLTMNGTGKIVVETEYGHGVVSKDDLVIAGGNYEVQVSNHALAGKDSIRIADGSFVLQSGEDAIHAEHDEDDTLGFVYIANGDFTINAGDDGIHSGSRVLIENGNIIMRECYEGIEGLSIDITGGNITLTASDDGLNAAGGNDQSSDWRGGGGENPFAVEEGAYIRIAGGRLNITAYGDGIDSNGALYVTGGETYVSGPENSGNGSMDYAGEAQITGGIFVAAGSTGMAQNFGNTSTQGAMLVNLSSVQAAGSTVELKDAEGKVLVSYAPQTKYSCVIISCPEVQKSSTYTLVTGEESNTIEMSEIIYGSGGMMGGGMPGGMGGHGGMDGHGGKNGGGRKEFEGEIPSMPEGGFNGEMPAMPEGGFNGEMPAMPEGGFNGEIPPMPEG